ncbi:MAG: DUF2341 domain-containing protein [Elusimicrobia bacterium]|nr:DUF2341 domain-containing protein [Elusimicrobiota bacterium]
MTSNTTWYPATQLQLDWPGSEEGGPSPSELWFDSDWKYRREINISNAGTIGLSDYQVWLPTTSFTSSEWNDIKSKAQDDMDDFRFTPTTATTTIPYWIDSGTNNPTGFWVRVTTIPTAGTSIFMYYGNPSASEGQSGDNTFLTFDDFEDGDTSDAGDLWITASNKALSTQVYSGNYGMIADSDLNSVESQSIGAKALGSVILETSVYPYGLTDYREMKTVDSVGANATQINIMDTGDVNYYDGAWKDSTIDVTFNEWNKIQMTLKGSNWDLGVNGSNSNGLAYREAPANIDKFGFFTTANLYVDCYLVRKYAATVPTIGSVGAEQGKYYLEGNYKANVLNSGEDGTKVHQVSWNPSSQAAGTELKVSVRSSNTSFASGDTTPSWASVSNGGDPAVVGRYIQWMSTFTTTSSTTTPVLQDITLTYTSPPPAPSVNYNAGDSYTQVTWKWTDNSSGQYQEDGFKVYSSTGGILKILSADVTYWVEPGLKRNTKYSRYVQSHNTAGSNNSVTVNKKTQPCVWQEKATTRTGPNAFGFEGDGIWTWKVPADGGSLLTITAYAQYNSDYGSAAKPKITLYNYGVNSSAQMTGAADTWEKLTVSGTPTGKGVLFLKVEGFSTAVDAKYFVDDIQVNQP